MITLEEAREIAEERLTTIQVECQIRHVVEKPYGWCFFYQSREYLETRNIWDALAGNAPLLVERETGHLIELGTAYPYEKYLEAYEKGFFRHFDLTITRLRLWHETIRMLRKLRIQTTDSDNPSRHAPLGQQALENALEHLPCTFENQYCMFGYEIFDEIDKSRCFSYQIKWRND